MFYSELDRVRERPAMFGIESVEDISFFIAGYATAIRVCACDDESLENFSGFQEWVKNYYDGDFSASWVRLIRYNSASSSASIELFFKLLQEYQKSPK
jgi:hypothetical protein